MRSELELEVGLLGQSEMLRVRCDRSPVGYIGRCEPRNALASGPSSFLPSFLSSKRNSILLGSLLYKRVSK